MKYSILICLLLGACASESKPTEDKILCTRPPVYQKAPTNQAQSDKTKLGLVGEALLQAGLDVATWRVTTCRSALQKIEAHQMSEREGVAFLRSELKAWETQQQLIEYLQEENSKK